MIWVLDDPRAVVFTALLWSSRSFRMVWKLFHRESVLGQKPRAELKLASVSRLCDRAERWAVLSLTLKS